MLDQIGMAEWLDPGQGVPVYTHFDLKDNGKSRI